MLPSTSVLRAAPDSCHAAPTCNPVNGTCSASSKPNGTACNDNDLCTFGDTCQSGVCQGNPVVCPTPGQCQVAVSCNPATGTCPALANKPDGTACNDGNACTLTDTCQNGVCVGGSPAVCAAQDQCHAVGTCNPATGVCSNPLKPNGSTCSDGNPCTTGETCQGGTCQGGSAVICAAPDQCHLAGNCDPATGQCVNAPPKVDGAACNDGDLCSSGDTCKSGVCTPGGTVVTCAPPDQCHDAGVCSPTTGTCTYAAKANGTACDDGNALTKNDVCTSGVCAGMSLCTGVVCTALDQCHSAGTCDPATGLCSNPAKSNGTACNDGNGCTMADTCQMGVCTAGAPVVCAPLDSCHVAGTCDPATGMCSTPALPDGTACDDGNACTQSDSCQSGVCTGASPVVCSAIDQCHAAGTCDPQTGQCSTPPVPDGSVCDDGDACTKVDRCQSGICTGQSPVVCTAIDACHDVGTCDSQTGKCSAPPKPDGSACPAGTCEAGACMPGSSSSSSSSGGETSSSSTGSTSSSSGSGEGGSGGSGGRTTGQAGGCGCGTSGSPAGGAMWAALGLVLVARRRRYPRC